jgi:hypothetical protein
MDVIINIAIFILLLFLYLHIQNQLRRNEDLEISEIDYLDNENMQEVCELKQPLLFDYKTVNNEFMDKLTLDSLFSHGSQEIRIKETSDEKLDYILLTFKSANSLMLSDTKSRYFSENNSAFIDEAGFETLFEDNNTFLKPALTVNTNYDFIIGSGGATLPLRYHTNARKFLCVNSGKFHIKMTPWKSRKYLHPHKDFENYDFRSPVNPWNPQDEFVSDINKIKFLEFDVRAGYVLFVPPYWWYSIKLSNTNDNLVTCFTYDSAISLLTNVPNYFMYYLQQSNITKIMKKPADKIENKINVDEPIDQESESKEGETQ